MNNRGFTLVELLATLVVLSIVVGITVSVMNGNFGSTKEKTEEVFVETIRDALDVYLSSDAKGLVFSNDVVDGHDCKIIKKHGIINVERTAISFNNVINSKFKPLDESDLVNPANEDVSCNVNAVINVYRDEDYVYYYSFKKSDLGCLLNNSSNGYSDVISNLPEGYDCD